LRFGFHFESWTKLTTHKTKAVRSPPARHIIENAVVRLVSSSFSLDVADGHLLGLMLRPRRLLFT
jgi:hypothetical protein